MALVGLFLALLELVRDKLIWVEQDEESKELFLKALTDEPAEEAVHNSMLANSRLAATDDVQEQEHLTQEADISIENSVIEDELDELDEADGTAIPIVELMPKEQKTKVKSEE